MLSSKDLHKQYSLHPCTGSLSSPYSQLDSSTVFNQLSANDMGAGTPINWLRIINFLKHVKHPCVFSAPGFDDLDTTGDNAIAMPYRILLDLDGDAYLERQPTIQAGTSYAVRNACDLARACRLTENDNESDWTHRMATEYLEHFAYNSLPDCLMMCGPDLVPDVAAGFYRAPGRTVDNTEPTNYSGAESIGGDVGLSVFDDMVSTDTGMSCIPGATLGLGGVAGAEHYCYTVPFIEPPETYCNSCEECPTDPISGQVLDPAHPCCNPDSIYHANECCNNTLKSFTERSDFSYWIPSDDGSRDGTILNGRVGEVMKHIGILERKSYGGYANFTNQCSGSNPPIIMKDIFLNHFKDENGFNYDTSSVTTGGTIDRARTISLILSATVNGDATTTTHTTTMLQAVRDLIYNGYGVLLLSNIGFPSQRDSDGVAYPDRIFYQTYNIIGYDDSKTYFSETMYILHCAFGDWISGGHPPWGQLPPGSFLVPESRLKCMIDYYPTSDFYGCRRKPCPPPFDPTLDCESLQPFEKQAYNGCGGGYEGRCDPYYCTKQQRAFGFLFAISLGSGFYRQNFNYSKYYASSYFRHILKQTTRIGN